MKWLWLAAILLCRSTSAGWAHAQAADMNLLREATLVRAEVARSTAALLQYQWTEQTEVLVGGSVKSLDTFTCRYDADGKLQRTLLENSKRIDAGRTTSNWSGSRSKADLRDYIERSVSRIHDYAPPKPELIDYALHNGQVSLGQSADGKSEIRFSRYYVAADSYVFTYDPQSKLLLRATVQSTLGSPKDPVTMEAVFETLPDGVNHISSAVLTAKRKNVLVRMRNLDYHKAPR